jgi:putative RNA 2'-phosphotransferase
MESLDERLRVRLSKKMAGLLRHYPHRYGLRLDREGWARLEDLVAALRRIPGFEWVRAEHVLEVIRRDEKGRYELRGGLVRARYGHSVRVEIEYPEPPMLPRELYHGTVEENLPSIRRLGILPGRRLWVHLSRSIGDAVETGRRHGSRVVVLVVDTSCLRGRGLRVYEASEKVYLVERVPPECIRGVLRVGATS